MNGYIVANSNCSTMFLAMALGPLHRAFTVEKVFVATMQAISGAGYPGVPSLDILGNVIPFIGGEEEKMEVETRKILGRFKGEYDRAGRLRCERSVQSGGRRGWTHGVRFGEVCPQDHGGGNN